MAIWTSIDMHAVVRHLYSTDIDDLARYVPETSDLFGFPLRILVGPENGLGEESFDVMVCTPRWLLKTHSTTDIVIGRHMLIVFEYDYEHLRKFVLDRVAQARGTTWEEIAQQLARFGYWEFEDYTPAPTSR